MGRVFQSVIIFILIVAQFPAQSYMNLSLRIQERESVGALFTLHAWLTYLAMLFLILSPLLKKWAWVMRLVSFGFVLAAVGVVGYVVG